MDDKMFELLEKMYIEFQDMKSNMATKEDFIQDSMLFLLERFNNLSKEEKETLAKSNITTKDIASKGNYKIRQFYMSHVA